MLLPQQNKFRCLLETCSLLFNSGHDLSLHVKAVHANDLILPTPTSAKTGLLPAVAVTSASTAGHQTNSSQAQQPNLELDFVALLSSVDEKQQQSLVPGLVPTIVHPLGKIKNAIL